MEPAINESIETKDQTTPTSSFHSSENSTDSQLPRPSEVPKQRKKKKKKRIKLFSTSILSNIFFIWIISLVNAVRSTDVRNVLFQLAPSETAQQAGDRLEGNWKKYFFY
jgi:hypothetical protein